MPRTMLMIAAVLVTTGAPATGANVKAAYRCVDGTRLMATFKNPSQGPGSLVLSFSQTGKRMVLPQALSADGGRYVSGKTQFWIKGNQATLTRRGRDVACRTKS